MRLTEKDITYITSSANVIEIPDIVESHKYTGQAIIKLGQLEDLEEELGIGLITLFKALKNGIYEKQTLFETRIVNRNPTEFSYTDKCLIETYDDGSLHSSTCHSHFYFKDYGKTWALTKEELE